MGLNNISLERELNLIGERQGLGVKFTVGFLSMQEADNIRTFIILPGIAVMLIIY